VTLLRAIVGQQVSVASAAAIWGAGRDRDRRWPPIPAKMAKTSNEDLRRRRGSSAPRRSLISKSLAEEVLSGRLDFDRLPADDEEAIAHLTAVKGIGRWTAEIYLLFAEGRPDIFPAGDLAVQIEIGVIMGLDARPTEKAIRETGPRPGARIAGRRRCFAWHHRRAGGAGGLARAAPCPFCGQS